MLWSAKTPSKRFGECVFLAYTPFWMAVMFLVVKMQWYEHFSATDYLVFAVSLALPCWGLPFALATEEEMRLPFLQRYSIKANVWVGILSYLGNHFFTHYFYTILGVRYTGPVAEGIQINGVPLAMYFLTHVYFLSYHTLVSSLLRIVLGIFARAPVMLRYLAGSVFVVSLAVLTAFGETWTISGFPHYTYPDLHTMLTYGSVFYAIFFIVSFPLFFRLDQDHRRLWPLSQVIFEAFAAMMIIMLLADIWRLWIGNVYQFSAESSVPYARSA